VLVTGEAWQVIEDLGVQVLEADVAELGRHRVGAREEAWNLVQIQPWSLAGRPFEALRTTHAAHTNLPADPGVFVGRERLLAAVDRYFVKGRKLVTLKGHGGIGKTRLANRYGALHAPEYGDGGGVWVCDLSEARSIDGICHAVARALGIPLRARSLQATNQLAAALAARGRTLLVLDNFEQITQYAEFTVGQWVRKAPRLRVLVTSRHKLGLPGEAVVEVTPLDIDEGVALFKLRAEIVRPDLTLTPSDDASIAEIVEQVECIPLAIEMAAAWLAVLTVPGICRRLRDGHATLDGLGPGERPRRHASLEQVMEGSWELLTPWEQEALVSCGTFRGGFTPEAAQHVLDLSGFRVLPNVHQVLGVLRDKSLLYSFADPESPGIVRWGVLESVREYAEKRLIAMGMKQAIERRHAAWYTHWAKGELAKLHSEDGATALANLASELENLQAVLQRYKVRYPSFTRAAILALDPVLATRGPFDLHLSLLEEATRALTVIAAPLQVPVRVAKVEALLARGRLGDATDAVTECSDSLKPTDPVDLRAWVQAVHGWVLSRRGNVRDGMGALQTSSKTLEDLPQDPNAAQALWRLGRLHLEVGEVDRVEPVLQRAKERAERSGDRWLLADILTSQGDLARHLGRHDQGKSRYEAALEAVRSLRDKPREGQLLARLAGLALDLRQNEAAEAGFHEARGLAVAIGDRVEVAVIDGNLGRIRHHEGRGKAAEEAYLGALSALADAGAHRWMGIFRGVLGALQHEQGRMEEAEASYKAARNALEGVADRRFLGLVLARFGALKADQGQVTAAEELLEQARDHLAAVRDPMGLAAVAVHGGHCDLARARAGHAPAIQAARERFKTATTPGAGGGDPPAGTSNDVRLALRLLRRSMELGGKAAA
jgi:predicted ATPase